MDTQISLLLQLAKKSKKEKKTKQEIITFLHDAKILTKKGNFRKEYSNLNKVVTHIDK